MKSRSKSISISIKDCIRHNEKLGVIIALLLWSTIIQLFINYDSPLHYSFGHIDSSWFFMCGKAWMNGLVPYVDFSDSKGPLLWLIYGIGYLIYPHGFGGVYILACFYIQRYFGTVIKSDSCSLTGIAGYHFLPQPQWLFPIFVGLILKYVQNHGVNSA